MIDRFTAKARESINLAVQAAEELCHSYVGTEHLLIGLLEEGGGVAARVLSENGVKKEKVISLVSQLHLRTRRSVWRRAVIHPAPEECWRTATKRRCVLRPD